MLDLLAPKPGEIYLDGTLGLAGHACEVGELLGEQGRVIGLDVDENNLQRAAASLGSLTCKVTTQHANFRHARAVLNELNIEGVDMLLADLGFASTQMDDPQRGFSFQQDGPLDMRMDSRLSTSAAQLVNELPERELADLIYQFGEERQSRRIARKITELREDKPIATTMALAEAVRQACRPSGGKGRNRRGKAGRSAGRSIDPATRTFMALRIAVNGELDALEELLADLSTLLKPGGRAAIISFHSLEDRMVKHSFHAMEKQELGRRLTRKPIVADESEAAANPRSRSAKLRGFVKDASGGKV